MGSSWTRPPPTPVDMSVPGTLLDMVLSFDRMSRRGDPMSVAEVLTELREDVLMPRLMTYLSAHAPDVTVHIVALYEALNPEEQRPVPPSVVFESQPYRLVRPSRGDASGGGVGLEGGEGERCGEGGEERKGGGDDPDKCPICLGEYKDEDMVIVLPRCGHVFHTLCIKEWMARASSCPNCRTPMNPAVEPAVGAGRTEGQGG